jgi:hypothetical protein
MLLPSVHRDQEFRFAGRPFVAICLIMWDSATRGKITKAFARDLSLHKIA